ncbi:hypothetical protein [Cryobacterium arcticum]|uniref:Protein kinase domain-containing protein n=1 Tax=Cryobacterium arcticum TaxID=670052 RepID=A0A1B1BJB1_9MICO|nr:hypothetical protein [Cryobacterium arcticum]ANP72654.1 hypothetical protein PA27867_1700 [Cryobacterium arcticum]
MDEASTAGVSGTVAGHRLVRRIGTGSRSSVYLGVTSGPGGEPRTAALQVFRPGQDGAVLDRQVRALLTVPGGHLCRLIDVATTPDGRVCLVLERLPGPTLDRALADQSALTAGEAVTIGATVTAALGALHAAGFSHPAIGAACVRFDASGRPVLVGLGALDDLPAGGGGAARRRDDLLRLAGFLRRLLDHLDPRDPHAGGAAAVLARFESAATARPLPPDLTGLEAALFDWAPAAAVRGTGTGRVAETGAEAGAVETGAVVTAAVVTGAVLAGAVSAGAVLTGAVVGAAGMPSAVVVRRGPERSGRPAGARGPEPRLVPAIVAALGAGRVRLRRVRRPVLVGVGLAVVLGAGGLGALGQGDAAPGGGGQPEPPSQARSDAPSDAAANATGHDADAPAVPTDSLLADDPAAATLTLLALRDRCLADASVLCLDSVDQAGSVASAADVYTVRQGLPEPPTGWGSPRGSTAPFTASVQERTGNSALVLLTPVSDPAGSEVVETRQPASALVIKGEAGWRLRELFDW